MCLCSQNHAFVFSFGSPLITKSEFLPRDAMHSADRCRHKMSVRPSVVCHTLVYTVETVTHRPILKLFTPSGSHTILVLFHTKQYGNMAVWQYGNIPTGTPPPKGGVECKRV